jgi:outer membrane lipoprotein carrier protein
LYGLLRELVLNALSRFCVYLNVKRLAAFLLCAASLAAAPVNVMQLLAGVERRYNRVTTLTAQFEETYSAPGRARQQETGTLYLRKPGRMRWDYSQPPGKQFVTDGKFFYLYSPASQRAQRRPMKDTADLHAPLGFLLGRIDFARDFARFESRPEGENTWVKAVPERKDLAYTHIEMLVTPRSEIQVLRVYGQDRSTLEFQFHGEKVNPPLESRLFVFTPPPGVPVTEEVE